MNYYAKLYTDNYNQNDIKIHISIIEGIYESNFRQKARVIGDINITENKFYKYRKHLFDVINVGENTITLKESQYNDETRSVGYEQIYTLLSYLLAAEGYTQERIEQITSTIHTISNNTSIKIYQNDLDNYIIFD